VPECSIACWTLPVEGTAEFWPAWVPRQERERPRFLESTQGGRLVSTKKSSHQRARARARRLRVLLDILHSSSHRLAPAWSTPDSTRALVPQCEVVFADETPLRLALRWAQGGGEEHPHARLGSDDLRGARGQSAGPCTKVPANPRGKYLTGVRRTSPRSPRIAGFLEDSSPPRQEKIVAPATNGGNPRQPIWGAGTTRYGDRPWGSR
jgi:hypothetical protein